MEPLLDFVLESLQVCSVRAELALGRRDRIVEGTNLRVRELVEESELGARVLGHRRDLVLGIEFDLE